MSSASLSAAAPAVTKVADPDMGHCTSATFEDVYEPAEDSFLLVDALRAEYAAGGFLRGRLPAAGATTLEVGVGSGVVTAALAALLGPGAHLFLGTDVNPRACATAAATFGRNGLRCFDVVRSELATAFEPRLHGAVDVLLFNPPYVPTPPEEMRGDGLSMSWAGGVAGREVLDRFLGAVPRLLSPRGVFYLVTIAQNRPEEIASLLRRDAGLVSRTVAERRAGSERLAIQRFWRPTAGDDDGVEG